MDISVIQEYLVPEVLILIPVLWLLGYFLKKTPAVQDWIVVWVLVVVGIVAALFIVGFNVNGFIQGVLVTGVAVLTYDLAKQTKIGVDK